MPEASIYRAVRLQREAIERGEVSMLRELTKNWVPVHNYLEQQINDIVTFIHDQRKTGKMVPIQYTFSLDRYRKMMAEAERAVQTYNDAANGIISGAEADAVEIGRQNAQQLIQIAEPTDPMWTRINKRETRIMTGMISDKSPLNALLVRSWPEAKDKLTGVLLTGISSGQGSSWIAQQMMEAADIPLTRALRIARTEVNRAYREANLETMRRSRAVIGYRRMCYPPTACFACLMMDGEFYEKRESFSDHPNGKCSAIPVTKHFDPINDRNWERGQDWFELQDPETQRRIMGAGRYDLWQQGLVDLRDMVYIKENSLWGGSPTVISLRDLLAK